MSQSRRKKPAEERKLADLALIEEELTERSDPFAADEDEEEAESADGRAPKKRGRPAIPIQWSRVMLVEPGEEVKMELRRIDFELELAKALRRVPPGYREQEWKPLFHPNHFALEHDVEELESWLLPKALHKNYARYTSDLRKQQQARALQIVEQDQDGLLEAEASVIRLHKAMASSRETAATRQRRKVAKEIR
jgi:hypothetical protein